MTGGGNPRRMTSPHPSGDRRERTTLASTQLLLSALAGTAAVFVVLPWAPWEYVPVVGWDVTAAVYLVWVWVVIWPKDAESTARIADHADPTRAVTDLLLLSASAVSLVVVGLVLAQGAGSQQVALPATGGLASIALSWGVVHTVFTLRYAKLYYVGEDGGVDFNQDEPPAFSDFAYLALTIGMTFQVSDTAFQTNAFRRTAVRHAMLSYVFGTGILAAAINLVTSVTH
ncbi:DUF1345 domain-containing protein [Kibdelosporangium lantanae]